jgi:pilus assembly protein CpaB
MRGKPLATTLLVVSIVGAAVALTHMASQNGDATVPKEYILASTIPLPAGTLLRAQDVVWQPVTGTEPDEIVRPNAAALATNPELDDQTRTSVFGAVLRHALVAGEPIRRGGFVKPGDREFLQVVLTPGARAIAIPVSTGGASTGLLTPGDHVDVVLTQNFKEGNTPLTRRSVGETVVENLRVLAIDTPDPKAGNNPTTGNFGRTVTLEVTAEEVEKINVAAELGKLSVALRSVTTDSTHLATASPAEPEHINPKWAGDVSPALYGAAQEKPVAVKPPPVQVFHGSRSEAVSTDN